MVSSQRVTGLFAIAIVAFMVATSFAPVVNAFAGSDEDRLTAVAGSDSGSEQNLVFDAGDGSAGITDLLSYLTGGADMSVLEDLIGGSDIRSLLGVLEDMDTSSIRDILAGGLSGPLSELGDLDLRSILGTLFGPAEDSEETDIDDIIEFIIDLLGLTGTGTKTYYIPDLVIGGIEFEGISIYIVLEDYELVYASVSVDRITSVSYTSDPGFSVEELQLVFSYEGIEMYVGSMTVGDAVYDLDAVLRILPTDSGVKASLSVFEGRDMISLSYEIIFTETDPNTIFEITLAFITVPYDGGFADFEDFTFRFADGRTAGYSASVEKATKDGVDITAEVNQSFKGFFDSSHATVKISGIEEITFRDITLENASLTFKIDSGKFAFTITAATYAFQDGAVSGTGLTVGFMLGHDALGIREEFGTLETSVGTGTLELDNAGFFYYSDDRFFLTRAFIDTVRYEDASVTVTIGQPPDGQAVDLDYRDQGNGTRTFLAFQNYATVEIGETVIITQGFELKGEAENMTETPGDPVAKLTLRVFGLEDDTVIDNVFMDIDYSNSDGVAVTEIIIESYTEPVTRICRATVTYDTSLDIDIIVGAGIGRSIALGGDTFLCVCASVDYNGEVDWDDCSVMYQFRDGEDGIWRMAFEVREENAAILLYGKELNYSSDAGCYLHIGDVTFRIHLEDGAATTAAVIHDLSVGLQSSQSIKVKSLHINHRNDGFTGERSWAFTALDVDFRGGSVSDYLRYQMAVDKNGNFTSSTDGEIDLDMSAGFVVSDNLTATGTVKTVDGALAVDLAFTDGTDSLGEMTVASDKFVFTFSADEEYVFGPFQGPWASFMQGAVAVKDLRFGAVMIDFSRNSDSGNYVSSLEYEETFTGRTLTAGAISFGEDIYGDDIGMILGVTDVRVSFADGYQISVGTLGLDREAGAARFVVEMGQDEEPAVGITCRAGDAGPVTDFVYNVALADISYGGMGIFLGDESYGAISTIAFEEDAFGETTWAAVTIPGSLRIDRGLTGVLIEDVAFEYEDSEITSLGIGLFRLHVLDQDLICLEDIVMTGQDEFEIASLSVSGFNRGCLINDAKEGSITVSIQDGMTVISVPALVLDGDASTGGNSLVIKDVSIVYDDEGYMPIVSAASVDASFSRFNFLWTDSVIDGWVRYNEENLADTAVVLNVDTINLGRFKIDGLSYRLSMDPSTGLPAVDVLAIGSLVCSDDGWDPIIVEGLRIDSVQEEIGIEKVMFDGLVCGDSVLYGQIADIVYSNPDSVLPLHDFTVAVGEYNVSIIPASGAGSTVMLGDGFSAVMKVTTRSATITAKLTVNQHMCYTAIDQYGNAVILGVDIVGFNAILRASEERSAWDISVSQKTAKFAMTTSYEGDITAVALDTSASSFTGKVFTKAISTTLVGTYKNDDTLTVVRVGETEKSQEYIGTGKVEFVLPKNQEDSYKFSLSCEYALEKLIVTDGDDSVEASLDDVVFGLDMDLTNGFTARLSAHAGIEYEVGTQKVDLDGLRADIRFDSGSSDFADIQCSFDRLIVGMDGSVATIYDMRFEGGLPYADRVNIAGEDGAIDLTFHNAVMFGSVFYAESMSGTVDGFDVTELVYDEAESPEERLFAYRGIVYFSVDDGITLFGNDEPVYPPEGYQAVFYVPSYEMTFVDETGGEYTYAVPAGAHVHLGEYCDVTPYPFAELGIPVTTDVYTVQNCNVVVTPALSITEQIDDKGVIRLETGSGFVFDYFDIAQLTVSEVKIITPQGIVMTMSVDALKTLASDGGVTVLSIIMDSVPEHDDNIGNIVDGLSRDNADKVLNGILVSVYTGNSVNTSGLGDVRITIPVDIDPDVPVPAMSCYHVKTNMMIYNGLCEYRVIDGQGYVTFTVNHFSEFIICEELDYAPSEAMAYGICALLIIMAVFAAAVFFRRQHV